VKILFSPGIGDGDPKDKWLDGLNRGLMQGGCDPTEREQVIAPLESSNSTPAQIAFTAFLRS
jgi:hypothetical protein